MLRCATRALRGPKIPWHQVCFARLSTAAPQTDYDADPSAVGSPAAKRQELEKLARLPAPTSADVNAGFALVQDLLKMGKIEPGAITRAILLAINAGESQRAGESWVHMVEALAARVTETGGGRVSQRLERIVSKPAFRAPAAAALAAYFVASKGSGDPETALRVVVRRDVPVAIDLILRPYGGIKSAEDRMAVQKGVRMTRAHVTDDYTSSQFLEQVAASSFEDVRRLYAEIRAANVTSEQVHAAFVRRFAETRQVKAAFDAWNVLVTQVPSDQIGTIAWSSLLRAASLAPSNAAVTFAGVWQRMEAAGIEPDSRCYDVKILCLTRHGTYSEVLRVFRDELQSARPDQVDMYIVNNMLGAAGRARDWATVDSVLDWAIGERKLKPTPHTFNTLLQWATRSHDAERTARYLSSMRDAGFAPDIVTYTQAVDGLLRLRRPINGLLEEMAAAKIKPNAHFWTTVAHGLGRLHGDVAFARNVFRVLEDSGESLSVETFGAMIDLELKYGGEEGVSRAARYLRLMPRHRLPPNVPSYNQVIRGALSSGRIDVALDLFNEMTGGHRVRLAPNTHTFMFLISPWRSPDDVVGRSEVRNLLKRVLAELATQTRMLDAPLASRVARIAEVDPDLVPADLRDNVSQTLIFASHRRH